MLTPLIYYFCFYIRRVLIVCKGLTGGRSTSGDLRAQIPSKLVFVVCFILAIMMKRLIEMASGAMGIGEKCHDVLLNAPDDMRWESL